MFEDLIQYWKGVDLNGPCFIHPCDKEYLLNKNRLPGLYVEGLFPQPYCGNLSNPKIVFLYLNPGYHNCDSTIELKIRNELQATIKQNFMFNDYPFFWLNPKYNKDNINCTQQNAVNPGAYYWNRLFNQKTGTSFLKHLVNNTLFANEEEARIWLSKNICNIELFPYHSEKYSDKWVNSSSSDIARNAVFSAIRNNKHTLFVFMRSIKKWINGSNKRENTKNINRYDGNRGNIIINKAVQNPSLNPKLGKDCLGEILFNYIKTIL